QQNICKYIHLPVQSGSDRILALMNRTYSSAHYLQLVNKIKTLIPDATFSTDIISGFPTETEIDHQRTLEMLEHVRYDGAFTFEYSPREHTPAFNMTDDVPDTIKTRRINEIIQLQNRISTEKNHAHVGQMFKVL